MGNICVTGRCPSGCLSMCAWRISLAFAWRHSLVGARSELVTVPPRQLHLECNARTKYIYLAIKHMSWESKSLMELLFLRLRLQMKNITEVQHAEKHKTAHDVCGQFHSAHRLHVFCYYHSMRADYPKRMSRTKSRFGLKPNTLFNGSHIREHLAPNKLPGTISMTLSPFKD